MSQWPRASIKSAALFEVHLLTCFIRDPFKPAEEAYQEAVALFKKTLTKDPAKRRLADDILATSTFGDVFNIVLDAKKHYEDATTESKTREGLTAFSQRLFYYGNIMDVLVQHHPEYVSLVWGAMKFIFGVSTQKRIPLSSQLSREILTEPKAIVEHERTGTTIVLALCEISESLPSVEIVLALYPTAIIKHAASMLYAHILRFLVRALNYYEESRLMRAVHTITRPAALRYQDLVELIRRDAETVRRHAATSSQAEIRDIHGRITAFSTQLEKETKKAQADRIGIHLKLNTLENLMTQVRHTLDFQHAVQKSNQVQIRTALSDVQLRQALTMVASHCNIDHKSLFQSSLQMTDTRAAFRQKSKHNIAAFWTSPKLQQWSHAGTSSTILVTSTFRQSLEIRRCCTEIVKQLLKDRVAVFWVFMSKDRKYPLLETLRSLVYQALSLDYAQHTKQTMSFQLSKYLDANFEDDYLNMLGELLQHLKHVYIIVNSEAMTPDTAAQCRACLQRLSRLLSNRGCQTILKVIMTSCGSDVRNQDMTGNIVLDLTRPVGRANQRRARKEVQRRRGVNFSHHCF